MRNQWLALVLMGGALLPLWAEAAFLVGDRVFVPMPSVHLREDGYATGMIESVSGDKYTVELRELVQGKGKTLYGTCTPGGNSPLAGAEIISDKEDAPILRKTFTAAELMPWRAGKEEYLERENVATIFYKWLGDGMAVTPDRARLGAKRARALGNSPGVQRMAQALDLAAIEVENAGGQGFPVGAGQYLTNVDKTLAAVTSTELQEPSSTGDTMRAILDSSLPLQSDDALAMAMAKVLLLVRDNWAKLPGELGSTQAAIAWDNTPKVLEAYLAALTQNGKVNYRGKSASAWQQAIQAEFQAGRWPVLP
ncbi:MAG: hypothetical protein AB7S56_10125 [Halothiobacillaceae bacterium]